MEGENGLAPDWRFQVQYGSLINHLGGNGRSATKPEVGMGVTFFYWSDRSAGTINEVLNEKTIRVLGDNAIRTDSNGMSDAQSYRYERSENYGTPGKGALYTLRKNGRWVKKGQDMKNGQSLGIGYRDAHYDYSF
jgi:hypothetical protein